MHPRAAKQRRTLRARGTVAVAIISTLTILQICVVAGAVTGTRDQEIITLRVDSARAFYAAEGAMNLAIREVMNGSDSDGDGTIGSIASRTISGGTTLSVTSATVSGNQQLTAKGVIRSSTRAIQATIH